MTRYGAFCTPLRPLTSNKVLNAETYGNAVFVLALNYFIQADNKWQKERFFPAAGSLTFYDGQ